MHRKCDGVRPCGYCNKTNKECLENPNKKKRGRGRKTVASVENLEMAPPAKKIFKEEVIVDERSPFSQMSRWIPTRETWSRLEYLQVQMPASTLSVLFEYEPKLLGESIARQMEECVSLEHVRRHVIKETNNMGILLITPHAERNDVAVIFMDKSKFK